MNNQHDVEPTQQTQPKKGEPITIPVPKKGDVFDFLEKVARTPDPEARNASEPDAKLVNTPKPKRD
jgi:hypothetical protein